jgi:hypothetical protein
LQSFASATSSKTTSSAEHSIKKRGIEGIYRDGWVIMVKRGRVFCVDYAMGIPIAVFMIYSLYVERGFILNWWKKQGFLR